MWKKTSSDHAKGQNREELFFRKGEGSRMHLWKGEPKSMGANCQPSVHVIM